MTNIDDVAQTLAEYERLAISTGDTVQIDPPEFSADGQVFAPFWAAEQPPVAARATVHRAGIPTTVYVAWGESLPAEDSWRALWLAKPMKLFGAYTVRAALRRAFRDVIGDRREPDETAATPAAPARDWEAEIDAANSAGAVLALHEEMKRARAVTPQLETQLRNRLTAAAWAPAEEPAAEVRTATGALRPSEAKQGMPQDFLAPTNRAARRAKSKGRRK
ncbi:hypothetical protein [Microbacterium sp. NPDC056052]|uniref:hypothetical protein n=1 Tax=Microbacterium sp. NPDC056052 TaxID=3345695 RepID=UPI0035D58B94